MKTYDEIWEEYSKDLDVWNMDLDTYQEHRSIAYQIWESQNTEKTTQKKHRR